MRSKTDKIVVVLLVSGWLALLGVAIYAKDLEGDTPAEISVCIDTPKHMVICFRGTEEQVTKAMGSEL